LLVTTSVFAQTDKDTVRWDDRAGQWVYTLFNPADLSRYQDVRYTPRTLIEPLVKSSVRWDKDRFEYRYRITNGASARQPISSVSVQAPKWDAEAIKHAPLRPGMTGPEIQVVSRTQTALEDAFVAQTVYSPNRWNSFLNVNRPTRVVFGWLVDYEKGYAGIAPRTAQGGFSVLRTELPGAAWMELQGDTPDLYNAPTLPRSGAVADHAAQVLSEDLVYVAVLAPAIVVPNPYDGAELARRIKAHVVTWVDSGLIDANRLAILSPLFDALASAATANDKKAAKAASIAIMTEAFKHHPGMTQSNIDDDSDEQDSKAEKRKIITAQGALADVDEPASPLHRVAARALVFDLTYLLTRMEAAR